MIRESRPHPTSTRPPPDLHPTSTQPPPDLSNFTQTFLDLSRFPWKFDLVIILLILPEIFVSHPPTRPPPDPTRPPTNLPLDLCQPTSTQRVEYYYGGV